MNSLRRFEYWPELVLVLLMLGVLVANFMLYESLWPDGEDEGHSSLIVDSVELTRGKVEP